MVGLVIESQNSVVVSRTRVAVATAVVLAAVVGYGYGTRSTTETATGKAQWDVAAGVVNVGDSSGLALDKTNDVPWTDARGSMHLGGRPECLPADGRTVESLDYDFVTVRSEGSSRRVVVLIRCGG